MFEEKYCVPSSDSSAWPSNAAERSGTLPRYGRASALWKLPRSFRWSTRSSRSRMAVSEGGRATPKSARRLCATSRFLPRLGIGLRKRRKLQEEDGQPGRQAVPERRAALVDRIRNLLQLVASEPKHPQHRQIPAHRVFLTALPQIFFKASGELARTANS